LLAFARQQPLRPQKFDVALRLDGMEHIITTTIGSPVSYRVEMGGDAGSIEADPSQFETAILNMVVNARDAMPIGGNLTIGIERVTHKPAIRHHAEAEGAFVRVWVRDTGTGIAPDKLPRIFEPFFTTKDVNKGTGLGLSQVYGFAKQSGGDIAVESNLGEGTTFSLYLPHVEAGAERMIVSRQVIDPAAPLRERRILLVEDNETVGRFALSALTELGQNVIWAQNAAVALERLEQGEAFDFVFSDVVMPGMSGIELAQVIRAKWPALPVILTSGYSHVLAEAGGNEFELVPKPYSMESLAALLS
jgi:CheY-like chemotaxis protein